MNKLFEYLKDGSATLEKVISPVNGELVAKWDPFMGYQILGGGLWQVGGPVESVWKKGLNSLPPDFFPKKILILGLGGGTISGLSRKKWPGATIIGVDLDECIVNLGRRYLGLDKHKVQITIGDAMVELQKLVKQKKTYDLVCVDLYIGQKYPEKFESEGFVELLHKALQEDGHIAVNRLYFGEHRSRVAKFEKNLKKKFSVKEITYTIEENLMLLGTKEKGDKNSE